MKHLFAPVVSLILAVGCLGIGGCDRSTSSDANSAGNPDEAARVSISSAAGDAIHATTPAAVFVNAAVGKKLAASGGLEHFEASFQSADSVIAFAVVEGTVGSSVDLKVEVLDAAGSTVSEQSRHVDLNGRTSVSLEMGKPDNGWKAGAYTIRFIMDGKPSWEVHFTEE